MPNFHDTLATAVRMGWVTQDTNGDWLPTPKGKAVVAQVIRDVPEIAPAYQGLEPEEDVAVICLLVPRLRETWKHWKVRLVIQAGGKRFPVVAEVDATDPDAALMVARDRLMDNPRIDGIPFEREGIHLVKVVEK